MMLFWVPFITLTRQYINKSPIYKISPNLISSFTHSPAVT